MKKALFVLIFGMLILPFFASAFDIVFNNPLNADILKVTIDKIVSFIFYISLGLGPLMIIIGAVIFTTAGQNPDQAEMGKRVIIYTLIGLAAIFLAKALIYIVINVLRGLG